MPNITRNIPINKLIEISPQITRMPITIAATPSIGPSLFMLFRPICQYTCSGWSVESRLTVLKLYSIETEHVLCSVQRESIKHFKVRNIFLFVAIWITQQTTEQRRYSMPWEYWRNFQGRLYFSKFAFHSAFFATLFATRLAFIPSGRRFISGWWWGWFCLLIDCGTDFLHQFG